MFQKKDFATRWPVFHRLCMIIAPYKILLLVSSIFLVFNATGDTVMISLFKPLLDKGLNRSDNHQLYSLSYLIIGLMLLRGITSYISTYSICWVFSNFVLNIRRSIFRHLIGMPISFFDQQSTGSLLSRITYDSEQIASLSAGVLITVVRESSYIVSLFMMIIYQNWRLFFVLLVITPTISYIINIVSKKFRIISNNIQNTMGQVATSAEEMLKGHKEVIIFGGQEIETERFYEISNKMRQQNMKLISVSAISDPCIQFIASLALAFVLYAATFPKIFITLSPGSISVIFSSMIALMRPLKSLTNVNSQFQRSMAACEVLFNILDSEQEPDHGEYEINRVKGYIEFSNVTFTYNDVDMPALNNINFVIPVGKTIAIVGPSGGGKSTIANLLMRFYDINKGTILLDGMDLREYTLRSLRNQIALVSQNVHLFNDTIANNIAYARNGEYSREEIEHAANIAHAMDFIKKMHNGLDTIIGENGILLSGGQRQRIAIARALLRNSPILILDEATSALDTESESIIHSSLKDLQKNRTFIIITHRLSTIEKADEIFVIDNGNIVQKGKHDILLSEKGLYAQLHKLQCSNMDNN